MCHIWGKLLYFLNNGSFIVQNFQNSEYRKPQGGGLYGSCKAENKGKDIYKKGPEMIFL